MMAESRIGFDPIDGILYTRTPGTITLEHMLEGIKSLSSNMLFPRKLKILEDAREAVTTFSSRDLGILSEKLGQVISEYVSIQHAVVHDNPKNFALTMLLQRVANHENYSLQVFSTIEVAKNWLLL